MIKNSAKFPVMLSFPCTQEMAREARIRAAILDISRCELIRKAVEEYLTNIEGEVTEVKQYDKQK